MVEREVWRNWYKRRRWITLARMQLKKHPTCAMCARQSKLAAAEVVDHIVPHRGDEIKFWYGSLRSLCADCHNGLKQRIERGQPIITIGADGYPIDQTEELREMWMSDDDGGRFVP